MITLKKIFYLLTPHEKSRFFILVILILIMAIIDTLGIVSVLPFISILSNPQLIETNNYLQKIYYYSTIFGVNNSKQFLFFLGLSSFLFLISSLIFRATTQYVQLRFSLMREYSIGKRLLESYLNQPYIWFLNQNSTDLCRKVLSDVNQIITQVIIPVINILAQVSVIISLLILLIFLDPFLALSTGTVLIFTYIIIFFTLKNILSRSGLDLLKANQGRFAAVSEAFGTPKEMKVMALEKFYLDYFSTPAIIYAKNHSIAMMAGMLPRYLIEAVAFGGVIILVLTLISADKNFASIVPIITIYTFAGYRLLPSLQQVYVSLTKVRFSKLVFDSLNKDLKYLNIIKKSLEAIVPVRLRESIQLDNVYFKYPNSKFHVLKKINIYIPIKKKIGIIGLTGGGKTTLVDIILGILPPSKGNLKIDNNNISAANIRSWQKIIGYVPQQTFLIDNSIAANIALGVEKKNININQLKRVIKIANLDKFIVNDLPNGYETVVGDKGIRLSGGQRQRVAIARALYRNPQVLILDEATSSLDNSTEDAVMEAIDTLNKKITIILIAHRLSTVKNCDKIYLIDKGIIKAEGNFNEVSKIII